MFEDVPQLKTDKMSIKSNDIFNQMSLVKFIYRAKCHWLSLFIEPNVIG